jgi:hypothetical protein
LLKEQLKTAETEYKIIETELARNLSPSVYLNMGINDLPIEILLEILALSIVECHRDIGNLVAVCRQWNDMIMGCPDFWASPWLTLTSRELGMAKLLAYYTACVKRSRDRLLTVSISSEHFRASLWVQGPRVDWMDPTYGEKFCRAIKGKNGAIFKRFKALHLNLYGLFMDSRGLSTLFTGHTPNLSSFSVGDPRGDMIWKEILKNPPIEVLSSPHDRLLSLGGDSFKKLKVLDYLDEGNLPWLSSIPTLESLTMRMYPDSNRTVNKPIRLPRLRKLTLIGE